MDVQEHIELKLVHSIHTTERRSFRGCRRRWDWIFHEGYYPTVTPKPLEFGVAFHKAMETYYNPITWHDKTTAQALALVAFSQTVEEQFKTYLKLNSFGAGDPAVRQDYNERKELGLGMLKHYFQHVSPIWDAELTPVHVEIEFEVPITSPQGDQLFCTCNRCWKKQTAYWQSLEREGKAAEHLPREYWKGLPVTYGGRIDCVMKDRWGRYWIVDWKTAARLSTGQPGSDDDYLWLDDQITSYCWALWLIGIKVAGFIYAEIKKAIPEEPEPNKHRRLGRLFSVSKQINTTPELYRRTVAENDPEAYDAGLYDDFLEYLNGPEGPRYHLRHQIHRNETELVQAGINIYNEAADITDPNLRIYPSAGRFGCQGCAFKDACLGKNRGEDYLYTLDSYFEKRTHHYYEKPSTDKDD